MLFALELHHTKSTKEIIKQLISHIYDIEKGSLGLKHNIPKLHRVLNVFVEEEKMQAALARISEHKEILGMERFFFFKSMAEVFGEWWDLERNKVDFFSE